MLGFPATMQPPAGFSAMALRRGEGWGANWYVAAAVPRYLFRIIMGTRNSQAAFNPAKDANGLYQGGLGPGITNVDGNMWANFNGKYPLIPCSAGVEMGDGVGVAPFERRDLTGGVIFTGNVPVFFGLKNLYGHHEAFLGGLMVSYNADTGSTNTYVAPTMSGFNHLYNGVGGMVKACENSTAGGYIRRMSMRKLCGAPTEAQASPALYYCDAWRSPKDKGYVSGNHVAAVCGEANVGASGGIGCFSVVGNGAQSWRTMPLCYFAEEPDMGG